MVKSPIRATYMLTHEHVARLLPALDRARTQFQNRYRDNPKEWHLQLTAFAPRRLRRPVSRRRWPSEIKLYSRRAATTRLMHGREVAPVRTAPRGLVEHGVCRVRCCSCAMTPIGEGKKSRDNVFVPMEATPCLWRRCGQLGAQERGIMDITVSTVNLRASIVTAT